VIVEYPKFRVVEIQEGGEHSHETWKADGWLGFLFRDGKVISGRWRTHGQYWMFVLESPQGLDLFRREAQWDALDGYRGERAEIVLDTSRQWRKMGFKSSDTVEFRNEKPQWCVRPDAAEPRECKLVDGVWDHVHCAIQWETIDEGG
jgi:hypothetical protein